MILVLSGEKGAGKTTLLQKVISEKGIAAQGFPSLKPVFDSKSSKMVG